MCPQQDLGEDGGESHWVLRVPLSPSPCLGGIWESPDGFGGPGRLPGVSQCRVPSRTLVTKVTMAPAGCSGSSSANTWHALPPPGAPACFATNPKILGGPVGGQGEVRVRSVPPLLSSSFPRSGGLCAYLAVLPSEFVHLGGLKGLGGLGGFGGLGVPPWAPPHLRSWGSVPQWVTLLTG